ncbi:MAG: hypothetical protein QT08_C0013G0019 [archaeon GW2011_AR17]|nr:MAG: hypothetical protein QT08_C0013G0019 [archaeon GW2011_AR17]MBS3153862.1 hypothetical protein [Candidatus Woesearchaeota archaeon]HIH15463.1 hypothetical protein [Nanoarchaeota archaeon]HIH59266.1 hypothetical protein [Nanoarchaeota archaeon]HII13939.1 hypothetical protein [Nanoarchaeota archaeon]
MKHLYQCIFILSMFFLLSFFVYADETNSTEVSVAEETTGFSAQNGFDWLTEQIDSDGSVDGDVKKTSFTLLALDAAGYDTSASQVWLETQFSSDTCYPMGACSVPETSYAVLALYEMQDDAHFDALSLWYADALSAADLSGTWNLEVVTSANGTCTVSYELEGTLKEVDIIVDEGVFTACGASHFLDLNSCLQAGLLSSYPGIILNVDCGDLTGNVVLAHVYKSVSTYYLLANENAAQAEFQVNNGCFGKATGSSCDVESTLYAGWALSKLDSSLNTLVYLKENYDDSQAERIALFSLVMNDESYLDDLVALQKSDGSFERDHYTTALAILALGDSSLYSAEVEDAKSYLREEQTSEGHWGENVENTALILYAAFSGDQVSPSTVSDDETVVSECDTDADCGLLYSEGYICDDGQCVFASSFCQTDSDCDTGEVCLDSSCVASDCDYGEYCKAGESCCDYVAGYNENVYNCPSDCNCGDGVCDGIESDASSGDSDYCAEDCGGEKEEEQEDVSGSLEGDVEEDNGSGILTWIIVLLLLIGLGVGGYFAYKKGYLDTILQKFKKSGGKGPSQQVQPSYNPFTSRVQGPPKRPY